MGINNVDDKQGDFEGPEVVASDKDGEFAGSDVKIERDESATTGRRVMDVAIGAPRGSASEWFNYLKLKSKGDSGSRDDVSLAHAEDAKDSFVAVDEQHSEFNDAFSDNTAVESGFEPISESPEETVHESGATIRPAESAFESGKTSEIDETVSEGAMTRHPRRLFVLIEETVSSEPTGSVQEASDVESADVYESEPSPDVLGNDSNELAEESVVAETTTRVEGVDDSVDTGRETVPTVEEAEETVKSGFQNVLRSTEQMHEPARPLADADLYREDGNLNIADYYPEVTAAEESSGPVGYAKEPEDMTQQPRVSGGDLM